MTHLADVDPLICEAFQRATEVFHATEKVANLRDRCDTPELQRLHLSLAREHRAIAEEILSLCAAHRHTIK